MSGDVCGVSGGCLVMSAGCLRNVCASFMRCERHVHAMSGGCLGDVRARSLGDAASCAIILH